MGNNLANCRSCIGAAATNQKTVIVVKVDEKVLEFKAPVLVKDILVNFSGHHIGKSKKAEEHLPDDFQLQMGEVYHVIPSVSSVRTANSSSTSEFSMNDRSQVGSVKRIKVVLTKQELQKLLSEKISLSEVLSEVEKSTCNDVDSPRNWKPNLDSIPEGNE